MIISKGSNLDGPVNNRELDLIAATTINDSSNWSATDSFKQKYTLAIFDNLTLIKCASLCSRNENLKLETDQLNLKKNSKIYLKKINNFASTLVTSSMSSITSSHEFSCMNTVCTCFDNSSFYSKNQNKCLKCRSGWTAYKNICYQAFTTIRRWAEYVTYCQSINSTLFITEEPDKYEYFKGIKKNLSVISGNMRTWVNGQYNTLNVFQWMNGNSINMSYFLPSMASSSLGCFAYYVVPSSYLAIFSCTLSSSGICEYTE
ncbi:unnamed protein product [Brachionus calyciflorus]|uniref:C-type lectin domain-containing protein n=1 Tax=Brachionus calyciflorus TaxID=104777 RepID=A0A814MHH7_9BILA|nr:unnamed protein product [Brachionus calyciflorus]